MTENRKLTDISVGQLSLLELLPVDARLLRILGEDIPDLGIGDDCLDLCRRLCSIVLPGLYGGLDALVVEVGVVLLPELAQDTFQLVDLSPQLPAVVHDLLQRLAELIDALLSEADEHTELATGAGPLNDLAGVSCHGLVVLPLQVVALGDERSDLLLDARNLRLDPAPELPRLLRHGLALLGRLLERLLAIILDAAVLLANLGALVGALHAAHAAVFLGSIAAKLVVTDSVVDVDEGDVGANVARVGAPEARQGVCSVGGARQRAGKRLGWRVGVKIRAGCCAGLVGPVRAIAGVVVDLGIAQLDARLADAVEGVLHLVEFGDYQIVLESLGRRNNDGMASSRSADADRNTKTLGEHLHSGPTPRGNEDAEATPVDRMVLTSTKLWL